MTEDTCSIDFRIGDQYTGKCIEKDGILLPGVLGTYRTKDKKEFLVSANEDGIFKLSVNTKDVTKYPYFIKVEEGYVLKRIECQKGNCINGEGTAELSIEDERIEVKGVFTGSFNGLWPLNGKVQHPIEKSLTAFEVQNGAFSYTIAYENYLAKRRVEREEQERKQRAEREEKEKKFCYNLAEKTPSIAFPRNINDIGRACSNLWGWGTQDHRICVGWWENCVKYF
ncbi:hypothetical protein [Leptospira idonii]|uniref:Uncharacterized protein n=1 Tax=Leptospira idonii TaxID=1193500 RepID=A0A4R9LVL0_9LEPT|nr:hypothetical protein [Leptospira idonii]TGN16943.1 hypothetical protein EHS15_18815 [Leptospira idonii]